MNVIFTMDLMIKEEKFLFKKKPIFLITHLNIFIKIMNLILNIAIIFMNIYIIHLIIKNNYAKLHVNKKYFLFCFLIIILLKIKMQKNIFLIFF